MRGECGVGHLWGLWCFGTGLLGPVLWRVGSMRGLLRGYRGCGVCVCVCVCGMCGKVAQVPQCVCVCVESVRADLVGGGGTGNERGSGQDALAR